MADRRMPPLYWLSGWTFPLLFGWRKRWVGVEHVPPGGLVLAANHVSSMDPFVLGMPLWPQRRVVRYMAKAELHNAWLGWAMRAIGTFPVRRGEADSGAMREALRLLREGEIVGMFPEGTRRSKGLRKKHVPKPHPGTARIALAAGVPLVPAAIGGTDKLLSLQKVTVVFGPPVELGDLGGMPRRQAAELATERLMAAIEALTVEAGSPGTASLAPEGE